jgi:phospholipid transport system substrate-binding protein
MTSKFSKVIALFFVLVLTPASHPLHADSSALAQLKSHLASLQQVLNDPKLAGTEHQLQRRKLARVILLQLCDFEEMSRRSLGTNARKYKNRLTEFTPLFVDFLEHAYMGTLEENGDAIIEYTKEIVNGDYSEIETKTTLRSGERYSVGYKLYLSQAEWRVYDISVESISLVNNYRSQFDRILSRESFDALLQELREKKEAFN